MGSVSFFLLPFSLHALAVGSKTEFLVTHFIDASLVAGSYQERKSLSSSSNN